MDGLLMASGPVRSTSDPETSGAMTARVGQSKALIERLLASFEGPIQPVWKSPFYVLGLLLVAGVIILLPVLYLGLIGVMAYGVYYHATHHSAVLYVGYIGHGRAAVTMLMLRLAAYFGPMLAGAVMVLFMIKPLFARPARPERRISFVRENEPVLFAFVEKLCEVVGAPPPRRIDVDCDLNASAGLRRGFLSMLGRDLVLRIGAPLVAGMTLQQFAGVLAHEFGHFSQGLGMRLTYVIFRVEAWFARVVYQRDAWDEQLVQLCQAGPWYLSLVLLLARLFVWLSRKILWVLMTIGDAISCGMLRQMEYDADRYEARVSGSNAFESSMRRLHALGFAWQTTYAEMAACWRERRLPDNLPAQIVINAQDLPEEVRQRIDEIVTRSRTRVLATHPSDAARIRRAHKEEAPGIFRLQEPASILFGDFDALCREVTFSFYQDLVGPEVRRENLICVAEMQRRRKIIDEKSSAASRFFGTAGFATRPMRIDRFSKVFELPAEECVAKLKRARTAIEKSAPAITKAYEHLSNAEQAMSLARQAESLLRAGIRIKPKEFGLTTGEVTEAQSAYRQADRERQAADETLTKIEAVLALRLEAALTLLSAPAVAASISQAELMRARGHELLDVLASIHNAAYLMDNLRIDFNALQAMEATLAEGREDERLIAHTLSLLKTQNANLTELRAVFKEVPYPYQHAEGSVSIAQYAIGMVPADKDLSGTINVTGRALDAIFSLHVRIMGELAQIGEKVEAAIGLQPLQPGDDKGAVSAPTN